jgi:hypothetical protein
VDETGVQSVGDGLCEGMLVGRYFLGNMDEERVGETQSSGVCDGCI